MRLFFRKSMTVHRLTAESGNKEAYGSSLGTIYGAIMSARPDDVMLSEGNPSKTAVLYTDASADIRDADKITCEGIDYIVKGARLQDGVGLGISYLKAIIEKLES